MKYRKDEGRAGLVDVDLDLSGLDIVLSQVNWAKPAGALGRGRFQAVMDLGHLTELSSFRVIGPDLKLKGKATFSPGTETFSVASFDRIELGNSRARNVQLSFLPHQRVQLQGGIVDFSGSEGWLLTGTERGFSGAGIEISAKGLDRLILSSGRYLRNADVELKIDKVIGDDIAKADRVEIEHFRLRGEFPPHLVSSDRGDVAESEDFEVSHVEAKLYPSLSGKSLRIDSDDFGAVLRLLDLSTSVQGGRIGLLAQRQGETSSAPYLGSFHVSPFVVLDAPMLVRMLTAASARGLLDLSRGEPLHLSQLGGEFRFADGVLSSKLIRASGSGIGLTAHGRVDTRRGVLDVDGSIVPAYIVNRLLGAIPGVGDLLSDWGRGGVLAVAYQLDGPIASHG